MAFAYCYKSDKIMDYKKEIENLQKQIDELKEELRVERCRRMKIDPYKQRSAYDLSRRE